MQKLIEKFFSQLLSKSHKGFREVLFLSLGLLSILGLFSFLNIWSEYESSKTSTFTKWDNTFSQAIESNMYFQMRIPASSPSEFSCMSERLVIDNLEKEIKLQESSFDSGSPVVGEWRGIDLSSLPLPQALYILEHKDSLISKDSDKNFSHCKDLLCILKDAYGDHDKYRSLLTYSWYLKTGVGINILHEKFSATELMTLWELSHSLPQNFFNLPRFNRITKSTKLINTCAQMKANGSLTLSSNCFKSASKVPLARAFVSYVDLDKFYSNKSFSSTQEWLALSNWQSEGFFDPIDQSYSMFWKHGQNEALFVSPYASNSPSAQFADTLAHLRFDPESSFKLGSDIRTSLSRKFFDGKDYSWAGLLDSYLKISQQKWEESETEYWIDCFNKHFSIDYMDKNNDKSFFQKVNNKLFTCMESKVPSFVAEVYNKIKREQLEGCAFFNDQNYNVYSEQFSEQLARNLNKRIFKTQFDLEKWGVQLLIGLKTKHEVDLKIDSTAVYVNCTAKKDLENCYKNRISYMVESLIKPHGKLHPDYLKQLKDEVLSKYRFHNVKEQSELKIKKFLFGYYPKLKKQAMITWNKCKAQPVRPDISILSYEPFNGADHFVQPNMINCINDHVNETVEKVIDEPNIIAFDSGEKLKFELRGQEKVYAFKHMRARLIDYFNHFTTQDSIQSQEQYAHFFQENGAQLVYKVISDKSFLQGIYSKSQVEKRCLERLDELYPNANQFFSRGQMVNNFGQELCHKVLENNQIQRVVANSIAEEWQETKYSIMQDFKHQYQLAIDNCYEKYPTTLSINIVKNSKLRQQCLESGHVELGANLISKWKKSEKGKYFSQKEDELNRSLASLKDHVLNQMKSTEAIIKK